MMKDYICVRFSKKSGKIDTTLEAFGSAMLKLWVCENTTKSKSSIIFEKDTGNIIFYASGTEGFPDIKSDETDKHSLGNIEDYCSGLLENVQ